MRRFTLFTLYVILFALSACVPNAERLVKYSGQTMGTTYAVTFGVRPGGIVPAQDDIDYVLFDVNRSLSTYDEKSLLSEINRSRDTTRTFELDAHFRKVYDEAVRVYRATDGAFNPAVGPLVRAWGFGADETTRPDSVEIARLLKLVDFESFTVTSGRPRVLRKHLPEAELDFSAIAKGYAVDEVGRLLEDAGIANYLVEIGGEVRARGRHPENRSWNVGIEKPMEASRALQAAVELTDQSMATSGNYRNYYVLDDGRKIVHTINPETGYPEINKLLSASVVAPDCITADAYATAFMVMGLEASTEFVREHGEPPAFFIAGGDEVAFQESTEGGFESLLIERDGEN